MAAPAGMEKAHDSALAYAGKWFVARFTEAFVDEMADAANVDPLSFRMGMLSAAPRLAPGERAAKGRVPSPAPQTPAEENGQPLPRNRPRERNVRFAASYCRNTGPRPDDPSPVAASSTIPATASRPPPCGRYNSGL